MTWKAVRTGFSAFDKLLGMSYNEIDEMRSETFEKTGKEENGMIRAVLFDLGGTIHVCSSSEERKIWFANRLITSKDFSLP